MAMPMTPNITTYPATRSDMRLIYAHKQEMQ
jgi:hypothetical protein